MAKDAAKSIVTDLLGIAGITANGTKPWDIQVHNEKFYPRVLRTGELGLGESYMDGWWDSPRLDAFIEHLCNARIEDYIKDHKRFFLRLLLTKIFNFQTPARAIEVGKKHYDLGNDLFKAMLDSNMNYTCAYWKDASNLDEAQLAKLELVCQKMQLKPGMRLLDIGCGWGAMAKYAAQNYGVSVVGITISEDQCEAAKINCANLPIEIRFQDYRDVHEKFDRIVSIGMFEHVGYRNYKTYMQIAHNCLSEDGLFLLHTIGGNISTTTADSWTTKYIFPNGMLPSIAQIGKAAEHLFVMEDWHNFGTYYDNTLMAWHHNFNARWDELKKNYDQRFFRMWNYYLLSCAGAFRAREMQVWQIVFSKKGIRGGYFAPR